MQSALLFWGSEGYSFNIWMGGGGGGERVEPRTARDRKFSSRAGPAFEPPQLTPHQSLVLQCQEESCWNVSIISTPSPRSGKTVALRPVSDPIKTTTTTSKENATFNIPLISPILDPEDIDISGGFWIFLLTRWAQHFTLRAQSSQAQVSSNLLGHTVPAARSGASVRAGLL